MSFGFGASDIISIGLAAWTVYTRLHDAPQQIKDVVDDLGVFATLLKNMDPSMIEASGLAIVEEGSLKGVYVHSKLVLEDLQALMKKVLPDEERHNVRDRLRWITYQKDVDQIRTRLRAALNVISAFNSTLAVSLGLTVGVKQQNMLKLLNTILVEVQAGRREGSTVSEATPETQASEHRSYINTVIDEIASKSTNTDIEEDKPLLASLLTKGIKAGEWEEKESLQSAFTPIDDILPAYTLTKDRFCRIEILSAAWGTMDVTDRMRQFFMTNVKADTEKRGFLVSDSFFYGPSRRLPEEKIFVMVWRTRLDPSIDSQYQYSVPQTICARKNTPVELTYSVHLWPSTDAASDPHSPNILSASYWNLDVTGIIARLSLGRFTVSNMLFGGKDPSFGTVKSLYVTYSYGPSTSLSSVQLRIIPEGHEDQIPPRLVIHAAHWADMDITDQLRAQITPAQTLRLNMAQVAWPDPWFGVRKTIAVLYQFGNAPLQLLVKSDGSESLVLTPESSQWRAHFNPAYQEAESGVRVLAAIWALEPPDLREFARIRDQGGCQCDADWFGFGKKNEPQTGHVFIRDSKERIKGFAAREGQRIVLPKR